MRIHASTIIRDSLTWPETYQHTHAIPGHDFAGTVTETFSATSPFKPGDEVFGMVSASRGSTWAQYAIVHENEAALKPRSLGWAESAAIPLSAQTAYEALFQHAGIPAPVVSGQVEGKQLGTRLRLLVTGAAGGVGVYVVQLAASAGVHVVAATSSNERNERFLRELGADEVVEYATLGEGRKFDIIVDMLGGELLEKCWGYVEDNGILVSVESGAYNFVEEHRKLGIVKEGVKALFFIVEGQSKSLQGLAELADQGALRSFVANSFPLEKAREAYDYAHGRFDGRGKIVLTV